MKCTIPEISWHNREPVLSVDIHPTSEKFYRLATGGADCHVLIWQLNICDNGAVKIEALSDLTRHQRAVNSVRWSPEGQYLATADDDANIIIWQLKTDNIPLLEGESNDKEIWIVHKVMRGHKEDIYDLCWSPNSQKLLSGSVDNTAILWDFTKGKNDNILTDHKGFVQGVTWDPKGHYIATISTDRICRIYESTGKQVKARIQKGQLPVPYNHYLHNKEVKYFHDDTFKSFFRRLDFSPDGTLLAVPSGRVEIEDCKKIFNCTYLFSVESWGTPIAVFPSGKECSTVARFCPILYELHTEGPEAVISLPFRMIVAVGTDHDVILYDTQQAAPFAYFKDIHYTRLTDLTWSKDGRLLIASSTDGFCALITFEPEELGVQYVKEESEVDENVANVSGCEDLEKDDLDSSKEKVEVVKPKKPNLLEKWAIKTPKRSSKDEVASKRKLEDGNVTEVTPKRIKPLPVRSVTDENVGLQKEDLVVKRKDKISPLLSFLKGGAKKKSDESKKSKVPTPLQTPTIILDEIEARDAWKCEKHEKSPNEKKNVVESEDYTEDFSLHLDAETNEEVKSEDNVIKEERKTINENCVQNSVGLDTNINVISSHSAKAENDISKDNDRIENDITKNENYTQVTNNVMEVKTKINTDIKDCNESEKLSSKVDSSTANKNVPKRRIPLITLSSPKQKKK